jgi:hypothetical protein
MEGKPFEEWNREEVKAWATKFLGETDAQKLWESEMSGNELSIAETRDLTLCGLTVGRSLKLLQKVSEKRAGKVLTDVSHSLS